MTISATFRAREGLLAVSAGALLWGTNGVIVHAVGHRSGLSAEAIGCYRLLFAAGVLLLAYTRSSLALWRHSNARQRWLLLASGIGLGGYQALYFASIGNVGVSVSTLVSIGVAPLAITVATAVSRRQLPSRRSFVILLLGIAGLALVSAGTGTASGPHPLLGLLEALGSGLGYGASTLVNRRLAGAALPLTLTTVACVVGALTLAPFAAATGLAFHADAATITGLGYMGVIATAIAYGLFFHGLRTTASDVASVLTLLEPLAATALAVGLLHEQLTVRMVLGGGLMLAAIAALYLRRPDPVADPERPPATMVG